MAKAVFRPGEITLLDKIVILDPPNSFCELERLAPSAEIAHEIEAVEEYTGPTAEDLRREAEAFKIQWEAEREAMAQDAKAEAAIIIKEAEAAAFQEVKRKTDQAQTLKREAEDEAERIVAEAKQRAAKLEADARESFERERQGALEQGMAAGREQGFQAGAAEVERLVERVQVILERAQNKRAEILEETEQQIIDLVLLIARKVVKAISENQRGVVIANAAQALRKVRDRGAGSVSIRVNAADLRLTTEHAKDFIKLMEGGKTIQIVEDSTVDQGGCIIETDFGEIDARISSQLAELETKILELSPIKGRAKGGAEGA